MTQAYPLTWPQGQPRAPSRKSDQFKATLAGALGNVKRSLELFSKDSGQKVTDITISSNVTLGEQSPPDPGVAVWFRWEGHQLCIAVDRYHSVAANLQAIHHVLEARRTELRHGGLAITRSTFVGFRAKALAGPHPRSWWVVLQLEGDGVSLESVEKAYKSLRSTHHPDKGGSVEAFNEITRAYNEARAAKGAI